MMDFSLREINYVSDYSLQLMFIKELHNEGHVEREKMLLLFLDLFFGQLCVEKYVSL